MTDKEKAFLIGLERLSRETGIVIGGCGCCGSPYLTEELSMPEQAGYGEGGSGQVKWISPLDAYDWEEYGNTVVKAGNHL